MSFHYEFHIFICQNQRPMGHSRGCCASKGAEKLLQYMKARVKELGIQNIRINKSGCLDQCERGPALVIYPAGRWYTVQSCEDIEAVIQSDILKGLPLENLLVK